MRILVTLGFTGPVLAGALVLGGCPATLTDADGGSGGGVDGGSAGDSGVGVGSDAGADAGVDAGPGAEDGGGINWDGGSGRVFIVDGSATGCGGAPCSDSNDGRTEATAFATPTACLAQLQGGDTCLIKNGTYAHAASSAGGSFPVGVAGTPEAVTTFAAFPGHRPKLCFDAACTSNHDWPTVSATAPYVRITGLEVVGVISVLETDHVRVDHNDVSGGQDCDGNFNLVRLDYSHHLQVDHNRLHGMDLNGCAQTSSAAGIKSFCTVDSILEHNTVEGGGGMVFGIDDKDTSVRNVIRFNRVTGGDPTPIREEGQAGTRPDCTVWGAPRETQIYGNLLVTSAQTGIEVTDAIAALSIHHNTISSGIPLFWNDVPMPDHTVRDNLLFGVAPSDVGTPFNVVFRPSASASTLTIDYDVYDPAASFNLNGIYSGEGGITSSTLADWRTSVGGAGCVGCEAHSQARTCSFVDSTDYKVMAGTACATASSTGGEVGAWGVASCVGADCP